jgi:hypothetical protein
MDMLFLGDWMPLLSLVGPGAIVLGLVMVLRDIHRNRLSASAPAP